MAESKSKKSTTKTKSTPKNSNNLKPQLYTHAGHVLTPNEFKFIEEYIVSGNGSEAVVKAGYKSKAPHGYANELLRKPYIADEIKYRIDEIKTAKTADAQEILEYFTSVLRGEIADQFGLEASLSERTKAAQELAKRIIDMPNRADAGTPEIKIKLDWSRDE